MNLTELIQDKRTFSGDRLRAARKARGLTQMQVGGVLALWGHILSYPRDTIERWESGKGTPRSNMLPSLSTILEVEMSAFFEDKGLPKG